MKKLVLTLVIGLFFVAFSNAQTATETKKEVKATYSVQKEKAATATPNCKGKNKAACIGKKGKACCAGKSKASCSGKSKASCAGKSTKSCGSGKGKATNTKCGNGKCGNGKATKKKCGNGKCGNGKN